MAAHQGDLGLFIKDKSEIAIPSTNIILQLTDNDYGLLSSACWGLKECPLQHVYYRCDLDEYFAFAASSRKAREKGTLNREIVENGSLADIFDDVLLIGTRWVDKHKQISPENAAKYARCRPYNGMHLKERLNSTPQEVVDELKKRLLQPPKEHVFECHYDIRKVEKGFDSSNIIIMEYQPKFPRKESLRRNFAKEIVQILGSYLRE